MNSILNPFIRKHLINIRHIFILTPSWNMARTDQSIARSIRAFSHDQLAMNDAAASSQRNSKKSAGGSPPAGGSMKPPAQQNVQVAASPVAAAPTASASAPIVIATNSTSDKKETQFGIPNPSFAMKMDDFAAVFFSVNDPHMGVGSA